MVYVWLLAFVAFSVVELLTTQLVSIWFAGASLVALIFAYFGVNPAIQFVIFIIASLLLFVFTKPLLKKLTKKEPEKTNADSQIGKVTVVTQDINNIEESGEVIIGGISWSARSADGETINAGEKVIIERIEGVRLIVKKQ